MSRVLLSALGEGLDGGLYGGDAGFEGAEIDLHNIMRAVFVPEGEHTVEFYYRPLSLRIGAILSSMAFVFVVGWLYWAYKSTK